MVQIYRKKWARGFFSSLFGYFRDAFVLWLPVKKLPRWAVKLLYGNEPFQFAFLVHPRAYQDIFISMPWVSFLKFFLRKNQGYAFFSKLSPFILDRVKTDQNINGYVIGQLTAPEIMFSRRRETVSMIKQCISLAAKICVDNAVIGLGGWFPMITKRGALLQDFGRTNDVRITNGHCGTLASIYMTVKRIAEIGGYVFADSVIAVIGVGKMGSNVVRALSGKVRKIILIDIQLTAIEKVILSVGTTSTVLQPIIFKATDVQAIRNVFNECHLAICATSSQRNILKTKDLPELFIAIDDSRPEALPRDPKKNRIVLEGGLLKITGAHREYDYGFGSDDNFFGCLGEAFVLACDPNRNLRPTIAEVDLNNFECFLHACRILDVHPGDFKTGEVLVTDDDIRDSFMKRKIDRC